MWRRGRSSLAGVGADTGQDVRNGGSPHSKLAQAAMIGVLCENEAAVYLWTGLDLSLCWDFYSNGSSINKVRARRIEEGALVSARVSCCGFVQMRILG